MIYKLVVKYEKYTHVKVQLSITDKKVRGDLGIMELNELNELVFKPQYGNAVVRKIDIVDYKEPEEEVEK